jgi:hypothetical protein
MAMTWAAVAVRQVHQTVCVDTFRTACWGRRCDARAGRERWAYRVKFDAGVLGRR